MTVYAALADIYITSVQLKWCEIAGTLKADGIEVADDAEIIALIAYLQRLGTDIKAEKTAQSE